MASDSGGESDRADDAPDKPGDKGWVIRDQDRFLPIANVARIMKRMVPPPGKISKEAKECVQECLSEFILFVASEAAERASGDKRKTIAGEDILYALHELGFEHYVEPMQTYLTKYRASTRCPGPGKELPMPPAASSSTALPESVSAALGLGDVDYDEEEPVVLDDDDDVEVEADYEPQVDRRVRPRPRPRVVKVQRAVVNSVPVGHDMQVVTLSDGSQLQVDGPTAQFLLTNANACAAVAESGNRQQVMTQKQMISQALQSNPNLIYADPNTGQSYVPVSSAGDDSGVIQLIPVEINERGAPVKRSR